jgi:hypothetical protein
LPLDVDFHHSLVARTIGAGACCDYVPAAVDSPILLFHRGFLDLIETLETDQIFDLLSRIDIFLEAHASIGSGAGELLQALFGKVWKSESLPGAW